MKKLTYQDRDVLNTIYWILMILIIGIIYFATKIDTRSIPLWIFVLIALLLLRQSNYKKAMKMKDKK